MKPLGESISASCVVESILDNDIDIKGVDFYRYDWLKWPAIKDSRIGQSILHDNNSKFLSIHTDELKSMLNQKLSDLKEMEDAGYCSVDIDLNELKLFKSAVVGAIQKLDDIRPKQHNPFNTKEHDLFELVNDIFSDSRLKNIGPEWDSKSFYLGYIHNRSNGDRILISNFADRKEYDLMCDIVSKVCKKRKLEYKANYGVDSVDGYEIRIYLK